MIPYVTVAIIAAFGVVIGFVLGLCDAASRDSRAEREEAEILAEARGIEVEELEDAYALDSWEGR